MGYQKLLESAYYFSKLAPDAAGLPHIQSLANRERLR